MLGYSSLLDQDDQLSWLGLHIRRQAALSRENPQELLDLYEWELKEKEQQVKDLRQQLKQEQKRNSQQLFVPGDESPFYEGEYQAQVQKALTLALKHMDPNRRDSHVIQSFLAANQNQILAEKHAQVDRIFKKGARMDPGTIRALEKAGFTVTQDGSHAKVSLAGDRRYTVIAACTPSDRKAAANTAAKIKRTCF